MCFYFNVNFDKKKKKNKQKQTNKKYSQQCGPCCSSLYFLCECCPITFWIPCCDVRSDFRMKAMFVFVLCPFSFVHCVVRTSILKDIILPHLNLHNILITWIYIFLHKEETKIIIVVYVFFFSQKITSIIVNVSPVKPWAAFQMFIVTVVVVIV